MDNFLTVLEKKESLEGNLNKFSPDFQTEFEHISAESLLENIEEPANNLA